MRSLFSVIKRFFSDEQGLSLLEVSLALGLMGLVAGASLPLLSEQLQNRKRSLTLEHQQIVFSSLANFALRHGFLPCPSQAYHNGKAPSQCQTDSQARGLVPYMTLGLSARHAKDGWGHDMVYVVEPTLTTFSPMEEEDALTQVCKSQISSLKITLPSGSHFSGTSHDPLALVLYSQGRAFENPISDGELLNDDASLNFVERPYSTLKEKPHRHLLSWWTRDNLLARFAQFSCPSYLKLISLKNAPQAPTLEADDF